MLPGICADVGDAEDKLPVGEVELPLPFGLTLFFQKSVLSLYMLSTTSGGKLLNISPTAWSTFNSGELVKLSMILIIIIRKTTDEIRIRGLK